MTPIEQWKAAHTRPTLVDRSDRGLVTVTGPDARSFLQSIVSQDVADVAVGGWAHTLLLSPQGKLDVDTRLIAAVDDELWLDTEPGFGPRLAESLNRFRIRVKVEITDRSDDFGCSSVCGPDAQRMRAAVGGPAVLDVAWPEGFDVIGPVADVATARTALVDAGAVEADLDVYETLRIEAGAPRQGADVDDRTIPQEAFLERDAVSFTKGCFLGQELVCRIDSRGHVNRFLRAVRVPDGARPPVGAEVLAGDAVVGTLTSVTPVAELPWFGLGFVRREVEPPADVVLRWPGGEVAARVETTPASRSSAATTAS